MVGIVVKMEAARSQESGDKKSASGVFYLTHLMRGARNIGTKAAAARIFSALFLL